MGVEPGSLAKLNLLTRDMTSSGLRDRLQLVSDATLSVTGADHASVRLCADDGALDVGARSGVGRELEPLRFRRGQGLLGWVAEHGRLARVGDAPTDPRFDDRPGRGYRVRSLLCVPVVVDGSLRAVLTASSPNLGAFEEAHEQSAMLLSTIAAQQLRLAELSQRTITDPHTGAYSRGYLEPRLDEELARSRRSGEALSLMLLDLDHFKRVNDTYGHAAGDEVLRQFVGVVRAGLRAGDVVVRRGGEEFVAILPRTSVAEAEAVAERVRSTLAMRLMRLSMGLSIRQTVSIGVAAWDGREAPAALEARADQAMYLAKREGRNRVRRADRATALGRTTLGKYD